MIIGMQGSRNFNDYAVFLRAMRTALGSIGEDKELVIMSAGPRRVNEMAMEFTNISERTLKSLGIKAKVVKMPAKALAERIHVLDYMVYFSLDREQPSDLVELADAKDIEVFHYRFA